MYRFELQTHDFNVGIRSSSSDAMKIFVGKSPKGEPIVTLSHCI